MKIYISHIQEEFQMALVLKKWIETAFADHCEVMVSTDPESIPTVALYLESNDQASLEVKALIILCSPNSIQKPWIPFEAGCAWMKKIFIIPICFSGLSLSELPQPLAAFQGLDLNQKDFGQKLFFTLAQELGISELPPVQYRRMREEIKQVQKALHPGVFEDVPAAGQGPTVDESLEPVQVEILLVLANSYGYNSAVLAEHFKMAEKKILPVLKKLVEGTYVYASPAGTGHVRYNLAGKGRKYLEQNRLI